MPTRKSIVLKPETLTYQQVEIIMYEMGWEPIDAAVFWRMVRQGVGKPDA